jgi:hypothetical protein
MPLSLREILENKHRISEDDIGFNGIYYFLPNEEIAFLLSTKFNSEDCDYVQSTLAEIISNSNYIDDRIKNNSSIVSLSNDAIALAVKLDGNNTLFFDNMQHFSAFSKDMIFKFYNSSIKRKSRPESHRLNQIKSTSLLAKRFLNASDGNDFYNLIRNAPCEDKDRLALRHVVNGFMIRRRFDLKEYMELKQAGYKLEEIHNYIDKVNKFRKDTYMERYDVFENKYDF